MQWGKKYGLKLEMRSDTADGTSGALVSPTKWVLVPVVTRQAFNEGGDDLESTVSIKRVTVIMNIQSDSSECDMK